MTQESRNPTDATIDTFSQFRPPRRRAPWAVPNWSPTGHPDEQLIQAIKATRTVVSEIGLLRTSTTQARQTPPIHTLDTFHHV